MYKGYISYYSEDAAFDALEDLDNYTAMNLHPEHVSDIRKVSYRKEGTIIRFESNDPKALLYVMDYASEDEDNVQYVETEPGCRAG